MDVAELVKPAPARASRKKAEPAKGAELRKLMKLRDEFVLRASRGRFADAASQEWRSIPNNLRAAMLLMAGVGSDVEQLFELARRDWQEMPPPERDAVQTAVRSAKKHVGPLVALAAKL